MSFIDKRAQLIANCKFLFGPSTEVLTLSHNSDYQAVAMGYDKFTASWTKFLHTSDASSTAGSILCLLRETEIEIAKWFSINMVRVPCLREHFQDMSLHTEVQGHPGASSSTRSDHSGIEFLATPRSSGSEEEIVKEALLECSEEGRHAAEEDVSKVTSCEPCEDAPPFPAEDNLEEPAQIAHEASNSIYEEHYRAEKTIDFEQVMPISAGPDVKRSVSLEPELQAPESDGGWGSSGRVTKDKTEKCCDVMEETSTPKPEPEAVVDRFGWRSRSGKKNKKKKAKTAPVGQVVDDLEWDSFSGKRNKEKKKGKEWPVEKVVDDLEWGSFSGKRNKKKKESVWPVEEFVDHLDWDSIIRTDNQKKGKDAISSLEKVMVNGKSFLDPVIEDLRSEPVDNIVFGDPTPVEALFVKEFEEQPTLKKLFVETIEAPLQQENEEPSISATSLLGLPQDTIGSIQPLAGHTIVLKILYNSKTVKETLGTMVTLKDNTRKGIFSAVNSYLNSRTSPAQIPSQRTLEIKYGAGKDGELELSALDENMWPEYLEYFRQCTKFPELTIDVVDG